MKKKQCLVHPRAPYASEIVRISSFVKWLVSRGHHGLFKFLELLQHLVHHIGVILCLVDILTRVVFNIKQAWACLFCALDWGAWWLTATNGGIFQRRSSGSLI